MAELFMCASCGQTSTVEDVTAGPVACPVCGKPLPLPATAIDLSADFEPVDPLDTAWAEARQSAVRRPRSASRRAGPAWLVPASVVAAVISVVAGGLAIGHAFSHPESAPPSVPSLADTWETDHRAEFVAIKAEAEARVLAGDQSGGYAQYQRLTQLAGQHAIHDPVLLRLLQDAQDGQRQVYAALLAKPSTPPTPTDDATADAVQLPAAAAGLGEPPVPPDTVPAEPPVLPMPVERSTLTPAIPLAVVLPGRAADQRLGGAIDRGVAYLVGRFRGGQVADGRPPGDVMHQGLDALCVYALLHAAQASHDPQLDPHGMFMSRLIDNLKSFPMETDPAEPSSPVVYARSLRAAALAVYNRPEDRDVLRGDVAWLVHAQSQGSYTYDDRYTDPATLRPPPVSRPPRQLQTGGPSTGAKSGPGPVVVENGPGAHSTGGGLGAGHTPPPPAPEPHYVVVPQHASPAHGFTVAPQGGQLAHGSVRGGVRLTRASVQGGTPRSAGPVGPTVPTTPYPPGPPPTSQPAPEPLPPLDSDPTPTQLAAPGPPTNQPRSLAGPAPWDNSNSQYGLLGVWAGAEAEVEVPQWYWKAVEGHWLGCQLRTGEWAYAPRDANPRLSMTCAGVASLLVTHEWLDPAALGTRLGRAPYSPALSTGLAWLEAGDHVLGVNGPDTFYAGYSAYGVERCALASGFKFFGTHDWFREIADQLLPYQFPTGGWGQDDGTDTLVNTAYMVLFLTRGRHPVLMNKLRMDPYWDNRPRDLANLSTFASKQLERPFNWQVVSFARPWQDWADAPVLYLASHVAPKLTPDDEAKLKAYADAGGLIFTHADGGSVAFTKWADDLARRLWPDLPGLQPLDPKHELYNVVFHLKNKPKLSALSNGSRLLMVHSPTDLSATWQERTTKSGRETFGLGVNLFVWAAGKANFRNRLDTPYIPEPDPTTVPPVAVARLRYAGPWDPEPYAWTRFARYFQWTTGTPVAAAPVDLSALSALKPGQTPVAVLTGAAAVAFTDADVAAVRAYVTAGGTLLVDACGGSQPFALSAETLLGKAFPAVPLADLPDADPLIRGGSPGLDDLTKPSIRAYAAEQLSLPVGGRAPPLRGLTAGTGRVVYAQYDLTTALLDTNPWGLVGYTPTYAQAAVKNVLLTAGH